VVAYTFYQPEPLDLIVLQQGKEWDMEGRSWRESVISRDTKFISHMQRAATVRIVGFVRKFQECYENKVD
jgi:hypothetical protein